MGDESSEPSSISEKVRLGSSSLEDLVENDSLEDKLQSDSGDNFSFDEIPRSEAVKAISDFSFYYA